MSLRPPAIGEQLDSDGSSALITPPDPARKHLIAGLVCLNLLVLATCVSLLAYSYRLEISDAESQVLNEARLIEQVASAQFDKADIALAAVATDVEIQLKQGNLQLPRIWTIVDRQSGLVPEIERIGLFDDRGEQICGLPADRCQRLVITDREYFTRLRDHPEDPTRLYGPYESRPLGQPSLFLVRPIHGPNDQFFGVAVAVLPLDRLRKLVSTARLGPGGSVGLRTSSLDPVLRQPELTGPDAQDVSRKVSDQLRVAIVQSPGEGTYRAITASDGVDRVAGYRRLERHALYVLAGRATEDFLVAWRAQVSWAMALVALFVLISWRLAQAASLSIKRQASALRLYDSAPCGYHTLDAAGYYVSINATELDWLGCSRESLIGKRKPCDFYSAEGKVQFAKTFPALASKGFLTGVEFDLISAKGSIRRVLVNAKAVYDGEGRFLHSNSVMHDITALHEARTKLSEQAQQQGLMLNNEMIGIVKLANRVVVWKNPAMDRIFGYTGDEWKNLPARALYVDERSYDDIGARAYATMAEGKTFRSQLLMKRRDGGKVWIDASGALLSPATGETMMILADIGGMKAAEAARVRLAGLEALNTELQEVSRLKSEFVANMSHELLTPMNAILGAARILKPGSISPDESRYALLVDGILSSGRQLLEMINQMLDYAKVESGKMAFDPVPIVFGRLVNEIIEVHRITAELRKISFKVHIGESLDSLITDLPRLQQMLSALIDNAVKFSEQGGLVKISAQVLDSDWWLVVIEDEGIGIDPSLQPNLFLPFFQLSSGSTKAHRGAGIGLALVKLVAQAQGGRIEVQSSPGQGSTFKLTLPRDLSRYLALRQLGGGS